MLGELLAGVLADAVVLVHLGFLVFVTLGGFLAWRAPRVLPWHLAAAAWALGIVTVGWPCPLTGLENWLRELAGQQAYRGGFIDRYVVGVVYPREHERLAQAAVAATVVASYAGLLRGRRRRTGVRVR